jgi:hypothetical protein
MHRKWAFILTCLFVIAAAVVANYPFTTDRVVVHGYGVQLYESTLLIERPAPLSIPLFWITIIPAWLFLILYVVLAIANKRRTRRGFDVEPVKGA